ncbi:MAG: hypothetical protein WC670_14480 [Pseudolabrys sp.]|jgi:hypothetical protein
MSSRDSKSEPSTPEQGARILGFRRRPAAALTNKPRGAPPGPSVVEDLEKYARDDAPDDYQHRMAVNIAALVFVAGLVVAGFWLADTMAGMRKDQDCVLSGRRNCAPVHVPAGGRF